MMGAGRRPSDDPRVPGNMQKRPACDHQGDRECKTPSTDTAVL